MKKATIPEEKRSLSQGKTTTSTTPTALLATAPTKIALVLVYFRNFESLNRTTKRQKVAA